MTITDIYEKRDILQLQTLDGTYTFEYVPAKYLLGVTFDGNDIKASPFTITVAEGVDLSKTEVIGLDETPIPTGP